MLSPDCETHVRTLMVESVVDYRQDPALANQCRKEVCTRLSSPTFFTRHFLVASYSCKHFSTSRDISQTFVKLLPPKTQELPTGVGSKFPVLSVNDTISRTFYFHPLASYIWVSTAAWHAAVWVQSPARTRHVILGVKTWLSTLEIVNLCFFRRRH